MAEYKTCPACHTINPPTAVECECGYRFGDGGGISDRDLKQLAMRKKLRAAVVSCAFIALFAVLGLLTVLYGAKMLLYVLGGGAAALAVAFVVLKLISAVGGKQGKN